MRTDSRDVGLILITFTAIVSNIVALILTKDFAAFLGISFALAGAIGITFAIMFALPDFLKDKI
jgi:hypothetical protein